MSLFGIPFQLKSGRLLTSNNSESDDDDDEYKLSTGIFSSSITGSVVSIFVSDGSFNILSSSGPDDSSLRPVSVSLLS